MIIFRHFLVYLGDELNRACMGNGTGAESGSFISQFWKNPEFEGHTQHILYFILMVYFIWVCFHHASNTPRAPPAQVKTPCILQLTQMARVNPARPTRGRSASIQVQEGAPPFYKQTSCTTSTSQCDRAAHCMC